MIEIVKAAKPILLITLGILIIPIFSIVLLSFKNTSGEYFKWYEAIFKNDKFIQALGLSVLISTCTALLSILLSFIISLSWFNKKQMYAVLVIIIVSGLLPPDIFALSICRLSQFLGFYSSNLFFLIIGLTFYTIPIGILIFWTRFYFIEDSIIVSAKDIGIENFFIVTKIISPLSKDSVISCFTLSFLLVFNEYPRTYYLSGHYELISEFLNGKLSSGTDESVYAGGSTTIIITFLAIIGLGLYYYIASNAKKKSLPINKDLATSF